MSDKQTTYSLDARIGEYVASDGTRYDGASEVSKTEAEKVNKADGGEYPVFVSNEGSE